jgi:hypothetical protein
VHVSLLTVIVACWRSEPPNALPKIATPEARPRIVGDNLAVSRARRARELQDELQDGVAMRRIVDRLAHERQPVWVIDSRHPLGAEVRDREALAFALSVHHLLKDRGRSKVACRFFSSTYNCFQTAGPFTRLPLVVLRFCADERLESVMVDDGSFPLPGAQAPRCP